MIKDNEFQVMVIPPEIAGYQEIRDFQTEIKISETGNEIRFSEFLDDIQPIRIVEYPVKGFDNQSANWLSNFLTYASKNPVFIPLWFSKLSFASLSGSSISGNWGKTEVDKVSNVLILQDDYQKYEIREIQTVAFNAITLDASVSYGPCSVIPVITAIADNKNRYTFNLDFNSVFKFRFIELEGEVTEDQWTAFYDEFMDYPIFYYTPKNVLDIEHESRYVIEGDLFQKRVLVNNMSTDNVLAGTIYCISQEERRMLMEFFDEMRGSFIPFWTPSYHKDYQLYEAAADGQKKIKMISAKETAALTGRKQWLKIEDHGNLFYYVDDIELKSDYTEITLDKNLIFPLTTDSRIENVYLARFSQDRLTFSALELFNDGVEISSTAIVLQELQAETPEPE